MNRMSLLLLLLSFSVNGLFAQSSSADLILFNGRIFTGDLKKPFAEAVAIKDERIVAVGVNSEIRKTAGASTRQIDLGGRTATPGFNDAHFHFMPDPKGIYLPFGGMDPSWEETARSLSAAVRQVPKGGWIFGTVGPTVVLDPAITRSKLDEIAPGHPVMLRAYYGHGFIANSAALPLLGISEEEADPMGGYYERVGKSRIVNGRMWEYAEWKPMRKLGEYVGDEEVISGLRKMADEAKGFGVTTLQVMPSINANKFAQLVSKADLPVRIRVIAFPLSTSVGRDISEMPSGERMGAKTIVSGIKWVLDGTPIEHAAALLNPYADRPDTKGTLNFSREEIRKMLKESVEADQQVLFHCAGDGSAAAVLDAMESFGASVDWKAKRVRIEHGDGVGSKLLKRAEKLGVVIVQNPTHFTLGEITDLRYGKGADFFRFRSYFESGIPAAIGSDGPMNPFLNIMLASIHPGRPDEAVSRETAVIAYTFGSAYAEFAEKEKGRIAPGQLADIAVLSQDIFSAPVPALPGTTSVLTVLGGKIVHDTGAVK